MLVDPKIFNSRSCLREFKKITSGKNLHKRDLVNNFYHHKYFSFFAFYLILSVFSTFFAIQLYFPRVDSFHSSLFCINNLFETINFFDSRSSVPQNLVNKLTSNLVCFLPLLLTSSLCNINCFYCYLSCKLLYVSTLNKK